VGRRPSYAKALKGERWVVEGKHPLFDEKIAILEEVDWVKDDRLRRS